MIVLKSFSSSSGVTHFTQERYFMAMLCGSCPPSRLLIHSLALRRGRGTVKNFSPHAVKFRFSCLLKGAQSLTPEPGRHQFGKSQQSSSSRKRLESPASSALARGEEENLGAGELENEVEDFDSISAEDAHLYMHGKKLEAEGNGASTERGNVAAISKTGSGMKGMAEAFDISSRTAVGITVSIGLAAVVVPLFMQSSGAGMVLKTRVLSYATLLCGFYMAWNIGANDVANAMGTSVGSGALTLRQAVVTAAVLEFSGAFLVGSHVSETMQKGILAAGVFQGKDALLFSGMLSSLAAAGTWLQVASYYGWPVSTTHCIIGAMVGFGIVYGGVGAVYWKSLARVVSSWVVSPVMGAAVSYLMYKCIRVFVYRASNPGQAAAKAAPLAVFVGVSALSFTSLIGSGGTLIAASKALGLGLLGAFAINAVIRQQIGQLLGDYCDLPPSPQEKDKKKGRPMSLNSLANVGGPTGTQLRIVYSIFGYLQVLSACFMSFAHGANDVANAIGPISAALGILHNGSGVQVSMSTDVLAWGGFGIVAGLLVWGYRVIATIGSKITELTPTRGFAAEFAAASVVVVASRLGLPISATHTLVGAVMGVGFARGLNSVRGEVVREIAASWLVTVPVGATLSVLYTFILIRLVPSLL